MNNSVNLSKTTLGLSIFSLVYFVYLKLTFHYELPNIVLKITQFFGELITIPLSLFAFFAFALSVAKIIKKEEVKTYVYVLIINSIVITWLIYIFLKPDKV